MYVVGDNRVSFVELEDGPKGRASPDGAWNVRNTVGDISARLAALQGSLACGWIIPGVGLPALDLTCPNGRAGSTVDRAQAAGVALGVGRCWGGWPPKGALTWEQFGKPGRALREDARCWGHSSKATGTQNVGSQANSHSMQLKRAPHILC